jgi:hypothetical protein
MILARDGVWGKLGVVPVARKPETTPPLSNAAGVSRRPWSAKRAERRARPVVVRGHCPDLPVVAYAYARGRAGSPEARPCRLGVDTTGCLRCCVSSGYRDSDAVCRVAWVADLQLLAVAAAGAGRTRDRPLAISVARIRVPAAAIATATGAPAGLLISSLTRRRRLSVPRPSSLLSPRRPGTGRCVATRPEALALMPACQ